MSDTPQSLLEMNFDRWVSRAREKKVELHYIARDILTLPLELREIIYDYCIPAADGDKITITNDDEKSLAAFHASSTLIASELKRRDKRIASRLKFVASSKSRWTPPPAWVYQKFRSLEIEFDTYETSYGSDHQLLQLQKMLENLLRFVDWIRRQYTDNELERVEVGFKGNDVEVCNPCWAKREYDSEDNRMGYSLATTGPHDESISVYQYLLQGLCKLPIARSALIWHIKVIECDNDWFNLEYLCQGREILWEYDFMVCYSTSVDNWLSGARLDTLREMVLREWEVERPEIREDISATWMAQ